MSNKLDKLLKRLKEGQDVYDEVYSMVYNDIKQMAIQQIRKENPNVTYSETELVHETYLKMLNQSSFDFNDRSHFLAIASNCMRQILIDHARKKKAQKRGNEAEQRTYVDGAFNQNQEMVQELLNIDEALNKLAQLNPRLSDVVTMRFYGGMKMDEIAAVLEVSESTVNRDWLKARGWLYKDLK
ncbi:MAG: sigma-70 family RNA polymerase sigma factor [Balneolaceae bacterium]|nr:MAG: sigma-70 family RNA polymerase sigma factor [Balneolaceae bacterium]